jgi:uncharacterized protein YegP (UPF0339 family)
MRPSTVTAINNNMKAKKIIATFKAKKGTWVIYQYALKGKKQFGNHLKSRNGNIICANAGFNSRASAIKNMKAVIASC